jgi:hypothetical protein
MAPIRLAIQRQSHQDDQKRSLTLAQPDNLPHIGLARDTYTITVTGEQTDGRFCVIDMYIPARRRAATASA